MRVNEPEMKNANTMFALDCVNIIKRIPLLLVSIRFPESEHGRNERQAHKVNAPMWSAGEGTANVIGSFVRGRRE